MNDLVERWHDAAGQDVLRGVLAALSSGEDWAVHTAGLWRADEVRDGADLRGIQLREQDLRGADLSFAALDDACFQRCVLDGADLQYASLAGMEFHTCSMVGARLIGAFGGQSRFTHCDLTNAELHDIRLDAPRFRECTFTGAHIVLARLEGAVFERSSLAGARISSTSFRGADLRGARLSEAQVDHVDLRHARLVSNTSPRLAFPGEVPVHIDTSWLDRVRPDAPITDARLQVARVKEGLRRRRRWWARLQTAEDWLTFDLPAVRSGTEASVPSSDLVGHAVWSWASPMMQRVLCEAQAWSAHGLDLRESPYPPLLAAIAEGVWFGRDHTGGMTVGLAWFDLRDPTVFESEEPFIEA